MKWKFIRFSFHRQTPSRILFPHFLCTPKNYTCFTLFYTLFLELETSQKFLFLLPSYTCLFWNLPADSSKTWQKGDYQTLCWQKTLFLPLLVFVVQRVYLRLTKLLSLSFSLSAKVKWLKIRTDATLTKNCYNVFIQKRLQIKLTCDSFSSWLLYCYPLKKRCC